MTPANKAKLDRVFSEYIRLRDVGANGIGLCISCGKAIHWRQGDAGHYVNRAHMATRYDEKNVNLQCRHCNRFREGEMLEYTQGLIQKYGSGILNELRLKKSSTSHIGDFEAKVLISHYKDLVNQMKSSLS